MTQKELSDKSGVNEETISNIERGHCSTIPKYLAQLSSALELSEDEKEELLTCALPALNPTWLDQQPAHQQAGLLLCAYRERKGMTQQELAATSKISETTINRLEAGRAHTIRTHLTKLSSALDLPDEESRYLGEKADSSQAAYRTTTAMKKTKTTELGGTVREPELLAEMAGPGKIERTA